MQHSLIVENPKPKRPLPPIPYALSKTRAPLKPISPNSEYEEISARPTQSEPYYEAAQWLITLESRDPTLISSPSSSSSIPGPSQRREPISAISELKDYGSPSYSNRPSPASLPSKAKRWIRGPATRAPPNTPTSKGWGGNGDKLGPREIDEEGKGVDSDTDSSHRNRLSFGSHSEKAQIETDSSITSGRTSFRSTTPCPTSRTSLSDSIAELSIHSLDKEVDHDQERSGQSDLPGLATHPSKEVASSSADSVLEGIGAELGVDVSLGYEIRSFKWDK